MAKYVKGDSRLRRKLRRFPEALRANIKDEMEASAEELRAEMERTAPRDEGDLARAAHKVVSRDGLSAKIGYSDAPGFARKWKAGQGFVALFKEFGTKDSPADPFIRPAYRAKLRRILDRIDSAVAKTLDSASKGDF